MPPEVVIVEHQQVDIINHNVVNLVSLQPCHLLLISPRIRLSHHNYGDSAFEDMVACLYGKTTHLSPHSQSPGNPFVGGFPGNFLDHLLGVHKVLVAWRQPLHVARAGLFHSVYGTFDYRGGCFDLRHGRSQLQSLIGPVSCCRSCYPHHPQTCDPPNHCAISSCTCSFTTDRARRSLPS